MRSLVNRVLGMRVSLAAGFVDSALASLGTFAIGLYATKYFVPDQLGAYAVFFGAFLLIIMVPAELIYRPAEVVTVAYDPDERLGVLPSSLSIAFGPSVAVALAFASLALLVPTDVGSGDTIALAVTAALAGFLSPAQDHVRRMFHQARRSPRAALMSLIQLTTVLGAILVMRASGVSAAWVPLGALAVANAVSLSVGLAIAGRSGERRRISLSRSSLYTTGGWLLLAGFALVGGQVAGVVLTTVIAGSSSAGYAQAAIVLAQPLFVVANGLGSVLNPVIMASAGAGSEASSRSTSRLYAWLVITATVALALIIGVEWRLNPLPGLFPNAYVANGLLTLTIIAQGLNYALFGKQFELIGGFAHTQMAKATVAGSIAQVIAGAFAGALQAFTVAFGIMASVVVKAGSYNRALRSMYEKSRPIVGDDHAQPDAG